MYLALNAVDIELFVAGKLSVFAVPASEEYHVGDVLQIKEPFKKISCCINDCEDPVRGVLYKIDGKIIWENGMEPADGIEIEEAQQWSSSKLLPDYAVRCSATVSGVTEKPLSAFSDEDIKEFGLYYNEPQMLIDGFLPIKNYERIYQWWKKRYRKTLDDGADPMVSILRLTST